jgi:hypothetical protein
MATTINNIHFIDVNVNQSFLYGKYFQCRMLEHKFKLFLKEKTKESLPVFIFCFMMVILFCNLNYVDEEVFKFNDNNIAYIYIIIYSCIFALVSGMISFGKRQSLTVHLILQICLYYLSLMFFIARAFDIKKVESKNFDINDFKPQYSTEEFYFSSLSGKNQTELFEFNINDQVSSESLRSKQLEYFITLIYTSCIDALSYNILIPKNYYLIFILGLIQRMGLFIYFGDGLDLSKQKYIFGCLFIFIMHSFSCYIKNVSSNRDISNFINRENLKGVKEYHAEFISHFIILLLPYMMIKYIKLISHFLIIFGKLMLKLGRQKKLIN